MLVSSFNLAQSFNYALYLFRKKRFKSEINFFCIQTLNVSTLQERELHLDVFTHQRPVLLLEVSTPQGLELHLDVSTLRRTVLYLDMFSPRARAASGLLYTKEACAATRRLYTTGA
jgi:hypothetical protein